VARWLNHPEVIAAEAPPVPGPHPDADPSGAPRGVGRGELEELRDLVARICIRGVNCKYLTRGLCRAIHPQDVDVPSSPWAGDELKRLMGTQPYGYLKPAAYERGVRRGACVEGGPDAAGGQVDRVARGGRAPESQPPPLALLVPSLTQDPPLARSVVRVPII
jgi:hypothetical protein